MNLGIFYANLTEFLARDHKDFRDAAGKSRAALKRALQINKEYPEAALYAWQIGSAVGSSGEGARALAQGAAAESEVC